jgi:hypothetical protein
MPLNRKRPFGTISGTGVAASYEQVGSDGKNRYYNSADLEVDLYSGEVLESPPPPAALKTFAVDDRAWADQARDLLRQANTLSHMKFAIRAAALIGGDNPPITKTDIVTTLQARLDKIVGPGKAATEPVDNGVVDLAAWGRGEAQIIFPDVAKAIRERYAREVSTIADALDVLVAKGVLTDDEAMKV